MSNHMHPAPPHTPGVVSPETFVPAPEMHATPPGLFRTPFSKVYWREASAELKKPRMLALAAVLIAVRVALKSVAIPIAPPTLYINLGFFINALGAGIFGPVVALIAAAISDTLGAMLFPQGVYFFPIILPEMAGSLLFALFLYRAPRSNLRVALSRFSISFFVNIVIQSPIMLWYYAVVLGKSYALFDLPRICKNLVLFPFEAILLILFLGILDPITFRMHLTYEPPRRVRISGKTIAFVLSLFIIGCVFTGLYYVYDYNTRNHTNDFSGNDRADFNHTLALQLDEAERLVLVNNIYTKLGEDTESVTYTVYSIAENHTEALDKEWNMLNSSAAKLDYLQKDGKFTVTINKKTLVLTAEPVPAG